MQIISISEEKKMYNTAEDVKSLVEDIRKSAETLRGIDLSENSFSPEALKEVLVELSKAKEIEVVIFKGIFTQRVKEQVNASLSSIVEHLLPLKKIAYFDISDNALSLYGMEILVPLVEKMHKVKHLVMNNNGIGIDGGEFLSQALENLAKESTELQSLEVGRNRLEESATKLGKALSHFPHFDALKIYQNSISSVNMGDLFNSLSGQSMRVLDVSDNFLLEYGSTVLSTVIANWPIEYLNVADCMMSDKGVEIFAQAIPTVTLLQGELIPEKEIDLSYNDITEESLKSVAEVLRKMPSTKFILTGNELAKKDIEYIKMVAEETTCEIEFEEEEEDELIFSSEEKEKIISEEEVIQKIEEKISEITIQKT
ncbi:Ran GTPase-activating protein 1 [Nematocida minor]|uniref:Ran GTPase-activating protein 1 n=1 Tax=Nematocida minor TaxID=1912983 RepID=UPI0022206205|nr:Ran GTPase-activating protein 1 [Nematocida minor]KAI5191758.1 Ran GTPase-activating protein 1 [Nematocida minor]